MFIIKDIRKYFEKEVWKKDLTPITKEYYYQYAETLLNFLLDHELAIKKVITSHMHSTFIDILLERNYYDTKCRLEASLKSGMSLIASPDVVASMIIGGASHCIIRWFESDERCPVDILLRDIRKFIDRVLTQ
jgi:hypothetical protein